MVSELMREILGIDILRETFPPFFWCFLQRFLYAILRVILMYNVYWLNEFLYAAFGLGKRHCIISPDVEARKDLGNVRILMRLWHSRVSYSFCTDIKAFIIVLISFRKFPIYSRCRLVKRSTKNSGLSR